MDYNHFRRLLEVRRPHERTDLVLLQEFVRDYPFCQTGQLLLTGAMHEQDHVGYDQQLRRTAAYAPDRTALFNLIHGISTVSHGSPFTVESNSPFQVEEHSSLPPINATTEDSVSNLFTGITSDEKAASENPINDTQVADTSHLREYVAVESRTQEPETELTDDPHDTIRRKLEQLLENPDEESTAEEVVPTEKSELIVEKENVFSESEPAVPVVEPTFDFVPAIELNLIQEIEKLPVIKRDEEISAPAQQPMDFFRWLSEKPVAGFGSYEMIDGDDTSILDISNKENIKPETGSQAAIENPEGKDLIEKFIRSEPRIVPQPKAQFFNPSVQAKRSVEEHEDLVSETLARIYAEQGNLLKARNAYERLRLLHPEKNAYFATLVLKMDNQLNSTTSEDL